MEAFESERENLKSRILELEIQVQSLSQALSEAQILVRPDSSLPNVKGTSDLPSPPEGSAASEMTPTARSMFEKINSQASAIVHLSHQIELSKGHLQQKEEELNKWKQRYNELKESLDNLKLELQSRPSVRLASPFTK